MTTTIGCGFKGTEVDLIVHNATIHTVNSNNDIAEAMAIKDGKVVAIGPERSILNKYTAEDTRDMAKAHVYPGFIDAHCHFLGYGKSALNLNLVGTQSWEECLTKVKNFKSRLSSEWVLGRGWDQNDWEVKEYPNKASLDALYPDKPVYLTRIDGHAAITNSKALELAGIKPTDEVEGGEILKDADGNLTGVLIDNGMLALEKVIPEFKESDLQLALRKAEYDCLTHGLTSVADAGLEMDMVNLIDQMQEAGDIKMRVYAMLSPDDASEAQLKKGKVEKDRLLVRSVKLYGDGALGSRGAYLKKPYHDAPDHHGAMIEDIDFYKKWAELCYKNDYQLNTHCIGDSASKNLLQVYADVLGDDKGRRWRIEHAQVVTPSDRHYFGDYGIIPSVQPTHATSDMYWAEDRLGAERMAGAYAYQSLLKENRMLALGTDFPIEEISPIKTFYAAVARKDDKNYPENGFMMEEALTREQALQGMTIWAAIANFEEDKKGSLEVGKFADFVVLDRDILSIPEDMLLDTQIKYTFINGEQLYKQ